jgi:CRISPR system Cascade subunit CasC
MLVSYPPSNLNRDDLGRPKTAMMGSSQRLRISSQSLKRAWRTSEIFDKHLDFSEKSVRSRKIGVLIFKSLTTGTELIDLLNENESKSKNKTIDEETARLVTSNLLHLYGNQEKPKPEERENNPLKEYETAQLCVLSKDEVYKLNECLIKVVENDERLVALLKREYKKEKEINKFKKELQKEFELLSNAKTAVDIAMYGRMLTTYSFYNVEAAVQVSHAITVNEVAVEDDYFTAVDDLNNGEEDMGAAHIGENEFASGLFYTYVCINRNLLKENLGKDEELTKRALKALVESATKVAPTGKQNSFASRAYATYLMVEKGTQQPRSLSVAFLEAVKDKNLLKKAIEALKDTREKIEKVYDTCSTDKKEMNAYTGEGSLDEILSFVEKPLKA